jgi:hypothetical protein
MLKFSVLVNFTFALLLSFGSVWGGQDEKFKDDERISILRASQAWADSLNDGEPERTTGLYANHISVYATFATKIDNYKDLLKYFTNLCDKENFKVKFIEQNVRVYGPTAINSGRYNFSYSENDKRINIPARFTFVYALTPSGWNIVEHHSSVLPE